MACVITFHAKLPQADSCSNSRSNSHTSSVCPAHSPKLARRDSVAQLSHEFSTPSPQSLSAVGCATGCVRWPSLLSHSLLARGIQSESGGPCSRPVPNLHADAEVAQHSRFVSEVQIVLAAKKGNLLDAKADQM